MLTIRRVLGSRRVVDGGSPGAGSGRHGMCEWRGMHQVFFSVKRAHHAWLGVMRRPLSCHGLTAARFDLMYALRRGGRCQRALADILGITGATLSRMVRSLEALGYVARRRSGWDGRKKIVRLTGEGRETLAAAYHHLVHRKAVRMALFSALASGDFTRAQRRAAREAISHLGGALRAIRATFRDRATLHYPFLGMPMRVRWGD